MKTKIVSLLLSIFMAVNLAVLAGAAELPEERLGNWSIKVNLQYQEEPITDGKLTAILVGKMDYEEDHYCFKTVFADSSL